MHTKIYMTVGNEFIAIQKIHTNSYRFWLEILLFFTFEKFPEGFKCCFTKIFRYNNTDQLFFQQYTYIYEYKNRRKIKYFMIAENIYRIIYDAKKLFFQINFKFGVSMENLESREFIVKIYVCCLKLIWQTRTNDFHVNEQKSVILIELFCARFEWNFVITR